MNYDKLKTPLNWGIFIPFSFESHAPHCLCDGGNTGAVGSVTTQFHHHSHLIKPLKEASPCSLSELFCHWVATYAPEMPMNHLRVEEKFKTYSNQYVININKG